MLSYVRWGTWRGQSKKQLWNWQETCDLCLEGCCQTEEAGSGWSPGIYRYFINLVIYSLRKQLPFSDTTTGFPVKWSLRKKRRNCILMTSHNSDLVRASDWLKICFIKSEAVPRSGQLHVISTDFWARFSVVNSRGSHWWRRDMSAVFKG